MAKRLQHRGGTTSQHSTFTGAVREVTVDTDKNTLVVHDGATAGGHPLATLTGTETFQNKTLSSPTFSGTATNFTSTGIDDNATSTAIIIDSSERVGIGSTSLSEKLYVVGDIGTEGQFIADSAFVSNTPGYSFRGDTDTGIFRAGINAIGFSTGTNERMRINSSGNVGIGTSSPDSVLHIDGTNPKITVGTSGSNVTYLQRVSDDFYIFNRESAGDLLFGTADTERMKIESTGKIRMDSSTLVVDAANNRVGVGTSVPTHKFSVYNLSATAMKATIGSTGSGLFVDSQGISSTMTALSFNTSAGAVGSITCSTTTSYNTTSDYRLKENVVEMTNATDRLKQLQPKRFNFIADADTTVDGFLAHEVQDIVPEAITGTKDATETKEKVVVNSNGQVIAENIEQADWETGKIADENDNTQYPTDSTWEATKVVPVYQGIDQAKLVPLLVKTIQELEARITALETQP